MSNQFDPENPFRTEQKQPETTVGASETMGLKVEQFFSTPGTHPFDELEWEKRSAKITGDDGQAIFEQDDIEVPTCWSQLATKVVSSKYFYGEQNPASGNIPSSSLSIAYAKLSPTGAEKTVTSTLMRMPRYSTTN